MVKYICALCQTSFIRSKSSESKSGLRFCSRSCKDEGQKVKYNLREIWPSHYGTAEIGYREKAISFYGRACNRCGFDKVVAVHHKDHNHRNDEIENLEVLCYNCHAVEHRLGLSNK